MDLMNLKIKKTGSILIVSIIYFEILMIPFMVQGCVMTSPLFSAREDRATVIVEKPPIRIIYSGEYRYINAKNTIKVIRELDKTEFKNYNFDDKIIVDSEHSGITTESYTSKHYSK